MSKCKKIDWNKWHETLADSMRAFDFDAAAAIAERLGLHAVDPEIEETNVSPIRGAELANDVYRMCETLIEMHSKKWKPSEKEPNVVIYHDYCSAYVSNGEYTATLKMKPYGTEPVFPSTICDPVIDVILHDDADYGPWFDINFNVVQQVF